MPLGGIRVACTLSTGARLLARGSGTLRLPLRVRLRLPRLMEAGGCRGRLRRGRLALWLRLPRPPDGGPWAGLLRHPRVPGLERLLLTRLRLRRSPRAARGGGMARRALALLCGS